MNISLLNPTPYSTSRRCFWLGLFAIRP